MHMFNHVTVIVGPQVEQPFWAQPQHDDGAAPPQQQWERSVDNPTFVDTMPWAPPASDAVIGPSGSEAAPGKQPGSSAEAGPPSATETTATGDHSSWPQQQPEAVAGSDPSAWQPQANGWHTEGVWQGDGGAQWAEGWQDGSAHAQVPDQPMDADATPAQWDPAAGQGDQSQPGEYGQQRQQQQSQEQYASFEGRAPDGPAQPQWDSLPEQQQHGAQQADAGAQQAYEGWGAAEGQRWQGFEGGEAGQVLWLLVPLSIMALCHM